MTHHRRRRWRRSKRRSQGDERFTLVAASERLGFYRNFERAIGLAPPDAELIALCDQDDRWDPDKLEALVEILEAHPNALLAYSDYRWRGADGSAEAESAFTARRNSYDDIASLLVANTVTGAASLFRRELLEWALPFPEAPGQPYHDHWLALCALAAGEIAYLDRPTYDRLRHPGSVTTRARAGRPGPAPLRERLRTRARRLRAGQPGWRLFYENRYLRIAAFAEALELRLGERIRPGRRRVIRRLIEAETSATATAWLAARSLRPLVGRDETHGNERHLVAGLLWRRLTRSR